MLHRQGRTTMTTCIMYEIHTSALNGSYAFPPYPQSIESVQAGMDNNATDRMVYNACLSQVSTGAG